MVRAYKNLTHQTPYEGSKTIKEIVNSGMTYTREDNMEFTFHLPFSLISTFSV